MSTTLNYVSTSGKAAAADNFEVELSVTTASSVPLELRMVEVGGTLGTPGTGKQIALHIAADGTMETRYFNGNCWTSL